MNVNRIRYAAMIALLLSSAAVVLAAQAPQTAPPTPTPSPTPAPEPPLTWHDATTWGVEGRAWPTAERKRWLDRFPATAEGKVTDAVWGLSRDSAGMLVRFRTDAPTIWADYTLFRERIAPANMTAIGASGLDLYARDESGKWRWVGVTRPAGKVVRQALITGLAPGFREYAVYLPL